MFFSPNTIIIIIIIINIIFVAEFEQFWKTKKKED